MFLLILSDELNRVGRQSIVEGVRACQNQNGSFTVMVIECGSDMRFLYCASLCISDFRLHILCCGVLNILAKFDNTWPDPLHTYLDKSIKFTLRFYSVIEFKDL
ncbi:hypothetical protein P5V15_007151 [Pogonomyrmex californicus]